MCRNSNANLAVPDQYFNNWKNTKDMNTKLSPLFVATSESIGLYIWSDLHTCANFAYMQNLHTYANRSMCTHLLTYAKIARMQ